MPNQPQIDEPRLDHLIAEYLRGIDRGEPVDVDQLLAPHPDLAEAFRQFLADADLVQGAFSADSPAENDAGISTQSRAETETLPHAPDPAPPAVDSPLPERLGRYRILQQLSQGAMGAVYLAEDTELQRKVALKVPKFAQRDEPELMQRFYREARAAATLHHPNICAVYDIGEHEGTRYITMAYISGPPLSKLVGTPRLRSERTIAKLVRKLALALAEAHSKGVVHRDLKPANILLDERNEPVITDFGLARRVGQSGEARLTQDGTILGTPAYMAPEQVSGNADEMGPNCDVYSLGVILYELLTGQLPYRGEIMAVLGQIIQGKPKRPSELRPDLDPRLESICLKLMAPTPADRYASAAEAANALGKWLEQTAPSRSASEGADGAVRGSPTRYTATTECLTEATNVQPSVSPAIAAADKKTDKASGDATPGMADDATEAENLLAPTPPQVSSAMMGTAGGVQPLGARDEGRAEKAAEGSLRLRESVGVRTSAEAVLPSTPDRLRTALIVRRALKPPVVAVAVGLIGVAILFAIILRIKDRSGRETVIELPEGTAVSVAESGKADEPAQATGPQISPKTYPAPGGASPDDLKELAECVIAFGGWLRFSNGEIVHTEGGPRPGGAHLLGPKLLSGAARLKTVALKGTEATDIVLQHAGRHPTLREMDLTLTKITDEGLQHLSKLGNLDTLYLAGTRVSDVGMVHLRGLRNLKSLSLGRQVSDAGLEILKNFPYLESLQLGSSAVTDAGLVHLAPLVNLKILDLSNTSLTGDGLVHLNSTVRLKYLECKQSKITDIALKHIAEQTSLQKLGICVTKVTDEGLQHLNKLVNLESLDLEHTRVSDAGLLHLKGLTNLRTLNLRGTSVTAQGTAALRKSLPGCKIECNGGKPPAPETTKPQSPPAPSAAKPAAAVRNPVEAETVSRNRRSVGHQSRRHSSPSRVATRGSVVDTIAAV